MSEHLSIGQENGPSVRIARSGIFSVGNPNTFEVILGPDNVRHLVWPGMIDDDKASEYAGWAGKEVDISVIYRNHPNYRAIELTQGTRSLSSLLGGFEAEKSEKRSYLERIVTYQRSLYQKYGLIDVFVSLQSLAVSRDVGSLIFTPPHLLSNDPSITESWLSGLENQVSVALSGTTTFEEPEGLVADIHQGLSDIL